MVLPAFYKAENAIFQAPAILWPSTSHFPGFICDGPLDLGGSVLLACVALHEPILTQVTYMGLFSLPHHHLNTLVYLSLVFKLHGETAVHWQCGDGTNLWRCGVRLRCMALAVFDGDNLHNVGGSVGQAIAPIKRQSAVACVAAPIHYLRCHTSTAD